MITVGLTKKTYWENEVEGYVIFLDQNFQSSVDLASVEEFYPGVVAILRKHQFKGKVGQSFVLTNLKVEHQPGEEKLSHFIFIGTGAFNSVWHKELEDLRRAVGAAVLQLKKLEIGSAVLHVPESKGFGVEPDELIKQIATIAIMADYEFVSFKSEKKDKVWSGKLLLSDAAVESDLGEKVIDQARIIGESVNRARLLCDMPPNVATPSYVGEQGKKITKEISGLKCAVFGRERAEELGMGGFLSVDAGSEQPGKFIVLEYDSQKENAPVVALVGKGVTFDSGGISLKPASSMTGMKFDMSGAAAVISAVEIVAQLRPDVNVVGLAPLVENMPSGRANKQDDIVTFMNGKTAEIINTDAEGRLILADALCYAEKFYNPDVIIDVATLTGACLHALGHSYTALMTPDEKLASLLKNSSLLTGDKIWELPLDKDFKGAIESSVADVANCGKSAYKASTITATWFLQNFVENKSWAHLDIAGTADGVPGVNYLGKGSTGAAIRLLVDFVLKYEK